MRHLMRFASCFRAGSLARFQVLGLAMALLGSGCNELVYPCHSNANCVVEGVQGVCVPAGAGTSYCAFGNGKCPSGLQWDTSAPSAIDNNCVAGTVDLLPEPADGDADGGKPDR